MKKGSRKYFIGFVAFLIVIAIGVCLYFSQSITRVDSTEAFDELATEVNDLNDTDVNSEIEEEKVEEQDPYGNLEIEIPDKKLDWNELHKENEDIYAWITVTGTTVDYPILQHPTDNTYYLNHNMDGSKGYPGCIYTENYNAKDFSDLNTVVYGHNLKDKTMFSSLHNFEDNETFSKNQYIFVYTEDNILVYQIFAVYEFNSKHLLLNYDYSNEYVYEQYIKDIFNVASKGYGPAYIRDDIQVTKDDKIITLSTCTTDHDSNQRFLVAGVLVAPKSDKE